MCGPVIDKRILFEFGCMEWEGFEIRRDEGSFVIVDDDFSVGIDSSSSPVLQLLTGDKLGDGEVITGKDGLEVEGDFEPLSPGSIVDIYGVMIKAFEGDELSYWFKMGSKAFYFSSMPGDKEGLDWLENNVDVAFLEACEDSISEAVKIKPRLVVPFGHSTEMEAEEFAVELRDRSIDVEII